MVQTARVLVGSGVPQVDSAGCCFPAAFLINDGGESLWQPAGWPLPPQRRRLSLGPVINLRPASQSGSDQLPEPLLPEGNFRNQLV